MSVHPNVTPTDTSKEASVTPDIPPAVTTAAGVLTVECADCPQPFAVRSSSPEAEHIAERHNSLWHGGGARAIPVVEIPAAGWRVPVQAFDTVTAEAIEYTAGGDVSDAGRAWSARVDAAVHGMDGMDPAALDAWMNAHATSQTPHVHEAALVAVWENTHPAAEVSDEPAAGLRALADIDDLADVDDF